MYVYARNNPLKYIDPDGRDVTFADKKLACQFLTVALQSDSLWNEYVEAYRDDKMDVQVVERGLKKNDQGSLGDATVSSTDENGVTKVVMYVDAYKTSDETVAHEWGHERDARLMGGTAFVRQGKQELKQFPDKSQHNDRPLEKSADRFKEMVNKERKEYQRQFREQKKAGQRAEKERKKRQPDEN